jgi:hypothetical protein
MSSTWRFVSGSIDRSFADLGWTGLTLQYRSQLPDLAEWDAPGNLDDDAIVPYGTLITIYQDDTPRFVGRVTTAPCYGRGASAEGRRYRAEGPWWDLEQTVRRQNWNINSTPSAETPSLGLRAMAVALLGQDDTGAKVSVGAEIAATVGYAISAGRPLQLATISGLSFQVPWQEVRASTCAEIIRELLRWAPDVVTWFDYTTSPPTLHFARRASLTSRTIALVPRTGEVGTTEYNDVEDLTIRSREDLLVPAVVIDYISEHRSNGESWRQVTTDSAGPGSSTDLGAICAAVTLAGAEYSSDFQVVRQKLTTKAFPGSFEGSGEENAAVGFWSSLFPQFYSGEFAELEFSDFEREALDGEELISGLNRYVVEGSVPEWAKARLAAQSQRQVLTIRASYHRRGLKADKTPITDRDATEVVGEVLKIQVTATSSSSRRWASTEGGESYTPPEPVPTGLAAALYAALSVLEYDGGFSVTSEEADLAFRPGLRLQFTGGRTEWQTANGQVQEVTHYIDTGRTSVRFGPPTHVSIQDLVERLRALRPPRVSMQSTMLGRATGKTNAGDLTVDLGFEPPTVISAGPSATPLSQLILRDEADTGSAKERGIRINPLDLPDRTAVPEDLLLKIRAVDSSSGTGPGTRWVISSEHVG